MFQFAPMTDRIRNIREKRDVFRSGRNMTLNTERTKLYTDYYKAHENELPVLKRSGALKNWAENRQANVFDDDIFVGTPGPDERSLSPYVEWNCRWIPGVVDDTDENFKKAWQSSDSVYMSDEQREVLREAYDFWKDRTLSKMVEGALGDDFWAAAGNGFIVGSGKYDKLYNGVSGMPQGHYVANFNKAVNTGFGEVKRQAQAKLDAMNGKVFGNNAKPYTFYNGVVRVCDAAITLSKRYAESCRIKAKSANDEARETELLRMADSLEWIMENPARTYWEGLQAILLYQIILSTDAQQHGTSMGRVDKYVGHLLEKQLNDGSITPELAQEYTDAFILRICDVIVLPGFASNQMIIHLLSQGQSLYSSIYNGLTPTAGINLTLGGCKADGSDDSTPATYCLLQTYGRLHIADPTVALRTHKNTPQEIWRLGIESSKLCGGIPQLQNDAIIIQALEDIGFSHEDAANYSIVGCVEPAGTGNEWPACGMTGSESIWNMVDTVLVTINGGVNPRTGKTAMPCKKLPEYTSFEELKAAFAAQMQYLLDWNVSFANVFELVYSTYFPCIAASTLIDGCMESGMDATEGGAKYNRVGLTACGTANVGDSLTAIKKLCFDDKTVSLQTMYDAVMSNWDSKEYEQLRQTITNKVPHYGNNIEEADELASWSLGLFADIMSKAKGKRGNFSGGTFTMTANVYMGAMLGATPDGRKAGEPIADAISPRQGLDINGPTAYLQSAAKLPHRALSNGDQLNIRFTPNSVEGDEGAMKLQQLIQTYFDDGGMQVQFNVVGTDKLREAQKNPDAHKDLIVRIAGFSTYFVSLSANTQEDFITRTEQAI